MEYPLWTKMCLQINSFKGNVYL